MFRSSSSSSSSTRDAKKIAARAARRAKANQKASQTREAASFKIREGGINMMGIYLGQLKPRAKAAGVAVAGQGGASASKKSPPKTMKVMLVGVCDAIQSHQPGVSEYDVVDENTIKFPARDGKEIKTSREALEKAQQEVAKVKAIGEEPTPVLLQTVKDAEENFTKANEIVDWVTVIQGQTYLVKSFANDRIDKLKVLQVVSLAGFDARASFSTKYSRFFTDLNCQAPLVASLSTNPVVAISKFIDLHNVPMRLPNPAQTYGDTFLVLFHDYEVSEEDKALGRGPVVERIVCNSQTEKDWIYGKEDEEKKLKACYTMEQTQEKKGDFPAGDFMITATCLEGDWTTEEGKSRNLLRRSIGINQQDTFKQMMAANPIPALMVCSANVTECAAQNQGNDWATEGGNMIMWLNDAHFMLREYLLQNCAQVPFSWVKSSLGLPDDTPDRFASVQLSDPMRPCIMNNRSTKLVNNRISVVGNKVVNASEYTGNLSHLDAVCEWRVMISAIMDEGTRADLAALSPEEGAKVLNGEATAKMRLPGNSITKVIYAVVPFNEEEKTEYIEATQEWKKHLLKSKSHAGGIVPMDTNDDAVVVVDEAVPTIDPALAAQMKIAQDAIDAEDLAAMEAAEAAAAASSSKASPEPEPEPEPTVELSPEPEDESPKRERDDDDEPEEESESGPEPDSGSGSESGSGDDSEPEPVKKKAAPKKRKVVRRKK